MTDQELKPVLEDVIARTPFARFLGTKVISIHPGGCELSIPVRPDVMHQHHGFIHGAIIGFAADSACAWAAGSVAGDVVTSEYKLNLLAPGVGQEIIGRGKVIKATARSVVTQAEVYCVHEGKEKLVAIALATIARVEPPKR